VKRSEFRREVFEAAASGLEDEHVKAALELFLRDSARREPGAADVGGCIEMASVVRSSLAGSSVGTESLTDVPAVLVDSRKVAEAARPMVEEVRALLFADTSPPFATREEAAGWLVRTAGEQKRPGRKAEEEAWEMIFRAQSILMKPLEAKTILLQYIDPATGHLEKLEGFFGSPIHVLSGQVEALARMTGFSMAGLVDYVLLGAAPLLPAFLVKETWVPIGQTGGAAGHLTRSVSVEVNSRHLSEQQFRGIWRRINAAFNPTRRKPARPRTVLLINTVRRCLEDRPNDESKTEFWKRVQAEFNGNAGRRIEKYRTWQAPRRTYLRLAGTSEYSHLPVPD
jgi:hypothetical protein